MIVRVDYHFHPNLPLIVPFLGKYLCKRKAEKIWRAFEQHQLDEAIKLIKNDEKLFGIVVHPHTPGTTSIYRIGGAEVTHNAIEKLGFLEKYNCSFTPSIRLLKKLGLHKIFKKKYHQMLNTEVAPPDLIKKNTITTVGSDAHHVKEIGNFAEIEIPYNEKDIFKIVTTKSGIWHKKEKENFLTFLQNVLFTSPLECFLHYLIR